MQPPGECVLEIEGRDMPALKKIFPDVVFLPESGWGEVNSGLGDMIADTKSDAEEIKAQRKPLAGLHDVAHPHGVNNLLAYGLDLPNSTGSGPVDDIVPHALPGAQRGLCFGIPMTERPDVTYVVESSTTMKPGDWIEIARKQHGLPWTGTAEITTGLLADFWTKVEIADPTQATAEKIFYRLRPEYLSASGFMAWISRWNIAPGELRTWRGFLEGRTSIDSTGIRPESYASIGIMVNI